MHGAGIRWFGIGQSRHGEAAKDLERYLEVQEAVETTYEPDEKPQRWPATTVATIV